MALHHDLISVPTVRARRIRVDRGDRRCCQQTYLDRLEAALETAFSLAFIAAETGVCA